jgi:hypothetical protein
MINALRWAALVAAAVTITLNASYGFKSSATLAYAVLFASLNAALDVAKCACLPVALHCWRQSRHASAILLSLLFLPLLANSLWCGLAEVSVNRAAAQTTFADDTDRRGRLTLEHQRLTAERNALATNRLFAAAASCALPRTDSQRQLCTRHDQLNQQISDLDASLTTDRPSDPAPHLAWLATWTGVSLPVLLLASAVWPIALAELCSSLGFFVTTSPPQDAPASRQQGFSEPNTTTAAPPPETRPKAVLGGPPMPTLRWSSAGIR